VFIVVMFLINVLEEDEEENIKGAEDAEKEEE
jgi:hypothetical protein